MRMPLWKKTIELASALAMLCALAAMMATLGAGAESAQLQTHEGMIADTHCSAKHSAAIGKTAADCTRVCVHAGEHFVLIDGDSLYLLEDNLDALKPVAGQRVRIVGRVNGIRISVVSVAPI